MSEHDDSPPTEAPIEDGNVVPDGAEETRAWDREHAVDDTVPALPALQSGPQLPAGAGWRADRRARQGASLGTGLWLAAVLLVAAVAAVLWVHLAFPALESLQLESAPAAESIAAVGTVREASTAALDESAALTRGVVQALANSLAAPPLVVLPPEDTENLDKLKAEADSLSRLHERLQAVHKSELGSLQLVLLDAKGAIARTWGELPAEAPALTSACAALLAEQELPGPRLGALSAARADGHRVAVLTVGPVLEEAALEQAARRAQAVDARLTTAHSRFAGLSGRIEQSRDQRLWLVGASAGGALLALLALLLFAWRPLRQGLNLFLQRTSARAAGQELSGEVTLPVELATADDLVMAAFSVAHHETERVESATTVQLQLAELIEICQRAAAGDLSSRAVPAPGKAGGLAVELNLLIESFERRALRLRSHARASSDVEQQLDKRGEAFAHLRKRSSSLGPLPGLLRDVATRLKAYADAAAAGEDVSAEQRKLAEALAARSRTAKAYLGALAEAVDGAEQSAAPQVNAQIEQELADLTLDDNFANQVEALRDLGAEEIQRRMADEALPDPTEETENPGAE